MTSIKHSEESILKALFYLHSQDWVVKSVDQKVPFRGFRGKKEFMRNSDLDHKSKTCWNVLSF
jgi:hypothetical protein